MQGGTTKERDKGRIMNPRDIKRRANAIRKAMTGEPLYDRKYKDLRVADLLIVLEDDNQHDDVATIIKLIDGEELCKSL